MIMETKEILQADYLDLIFEKRNKAYGSYQLRKHANSRSLKALGITLSIILLGIGTPFALSKLDAKEPGILAGVDKEIKVSLIEEPVYKIPEKVKPKVPVAAPKPIASTVKNDIPKIVANNAVPPKMKPPEIDELKDKLSGPANNPGQPDGTETAMSDKLPTGPTGNGDGPGKDKTGGGGGEESKEAISFAQEMPEFPGGMPALMAYLQKNLRYPAQAREEEIQGKVMINFIVGKNGEIESAKMLRGIGAGCDKEALRVVNAMPKWKPGKQNGRNVRVYFTLPIVFKLQ